MSTSFSFGDLNTHSNGAVSTIINDPINDPNNDGKPVRASVKQGINVEENRLKRQNNQFNLRKKNRDEEMFKRRRNVADFSIADNNSNDNCKDGAMDINNNINNNTLDNDEETAAIISSLYSSNTPFPPRLLEALANPNDVVSFSRAVRMLNDIIQQQSDISIIQKFIDNNIVPLILQLMVSVENIQLKNLLACIVSNLAIGNSNQINYLIHCGCIQALLQLFKVQNFELWESALYGISNIAGDNAQARDVVLKEGVLINILQLCTPEIASKSKKLFETTVWCLSNLTRHKPKPDFALVSQAFPVLEKLLECNNPDVLQSTCTALLQLTDDETENNAKLDYICKRYPNILNKIVYILSQSNTIGDVNLRKNIQVCLTRICGNYAVGEHMHCQMLIDAKGIPILFNILKNCEFPPVRQFICWTLSNIASGTTSQIQLLIEEPGLISTMVNMVVADHFDIIKEAIWVLSNAVALSQPSQLNALIEQKVLIAFCSALNAEYNVDIINQSLQGIQTILSYGKSLMISQSLTENPFLCDVHDLKGTDQIEYLQGHENSDIQKLATNIIINFFEIEEDSMLMSEVTQNSSNFQSQPTFSSSQPQQQQHQPQQQFTFNSNNFTTPYQFNPF